MAITLKVGKLENFESYNYLSLKATHKWRSASGWNIWDL